MIIYASQNDIVEIRYTDFPDECNNTLLIELNEFDKDDIPVEPYVNMSWSNVPVEKMGSQ